MGDVGKGFSPSAFGDRFEQEARDRCTGRCRGKPAMIQELARFVVAEADHRGVAKMLRRLAELKATDDDFADIEMDCHGEFWDAVRLGDFDTVDTGLAEITHRRTYSRPKPPEKAISTIHKAKGLECNSVIVMPCDARTFRISPMQGVSSMSRSAGRRAACCWSFRATAQARYLLSSQIPIRYDIVRPQTVDFGVFLLTPSSTS